MTFDQVYETLPGNGWLTREEARLLWSFAGTFDGPILEVGCYEGRSTVLLASFGRPVYCVDPFDDAFQGVDGSGEKTYQSYRANLDDRKIANVMTYRMRLEDLVTRPKVGFSYLDGSHTYGGTLHQIRVAVECGARGIAIHDVNDSGEGLEIKLATLEMLGPWSERVGRLAVWSV